MPEPDEVAANPKLAARLLDIEAQVQTIIKVVQAEAEGQANGLILGSADSLGIRLGPKDYIYDRSTNIFRRNLANS